MVWGSIFDHGGFIFNVIQGRGCVFCVKLSIETTLERLVLKNAAQRTNQHVKSPSGARAKIIVGRSVARSLGRSVARSLGVSVARSLGVSVDRSVARSIGRSTGRLAG